MIIMMNGYTAVGKSTISRLLCEKIPDSFVIHSSEVRANMNLTPDKLDYEFKLDDDYFVNTISKKVYEKMVSIAEKGLESATYIILDAAFNFTWQRILVYDLVDLLDEKLLVVRITCSDEKIIIDRIEDRKNRNDVFSEAKDIDTYYSTKKLSEDIEKDEYLKKKEISILHYDTKYQNEANIVDSIYNKIMEIE